MRLRIPGAAKAFLVLTAAGLLLGGCHYGHRAYHGGPHYAAPGYGQHYYGKDRKYRHGQHHRHGYRGYR